MNLTGRIYTGACLLRFFLQQRVEILHHKAISVLELCSFGHRRSNFADLDKFLF